MARVRRYTPELAGPYAAAGIWTPDYAVDYWRRNARERGRL